MVVVYIKQNYNIMFYVNRIWTFKVRMCVPLNEIESGNWDEIELLTSPREIEWQLCVVKLNEFLFRLNEINFKRNDIKWNWRLKEWKWTMRAESWQKSRKLERLFWMQFWWNWAGKPILSTHPPPTHTRMHKRPHVCPNFPSGMSVKGGIFGARKPGKWSVLGNC